MSENFYPKIAEFDELLLLAKHAPEQLDLVQKQLNEECLASASNPRSAWKLRHLLKQISQIKHRYHHPQLVCQQLQLLLHKILFDSDEAGLKSTDHSKMKAKACKPAVTAKVMEFKR
jgi:hypothetical protein